MIAERAGRACDFLLLVFAFALPLSIAVSEIALVATLVAWLVSSPWRRPAAPGARSLGVATLALVATWVLASTFAVDPVASFIKVRKIYSIALVLVVLDRVRDTRAAGRLAAAALTGGAVSAAFGVLYFAYMRVSGIFPAYRLESVFSTAMTTGNVFATLAVAALGEWLIRSGTGAGARRAFGAFVLIALALLGTKTRSSWIAFVTGSAVILGRLRPRLLLVGVVVVAIGVALGPQELRDRIASTFDPAYETNAGRISLWRSGAVVVREHPWTGVGLADHYALIERYRRPDATFHAGHFHNNLVQVAASTGLIGLAAYLGWMLLTAGLLLGRLRHAGPQGAPRALVGLGIWIAFQVHGMFDWSFGDAEVANQLFLWVGLGLATALSPSSTST